MRIFTRPDRPDRRGTPSTTSHFVPAAESAAGTPDSRLPQTRAVTTTTAGNRDPRRIPGQERCPGQPVPPASRCACTPVPEDNEDSNQSPASP